MATTLPQQSFAVFRQPFEPSLLSRSYTYKNTHTHTTHKRSASVACSDDKGAVRYATMSSPLSFTHHIEPDGASRRMRLLQTQPTAEPDGLQPDPACRHVQAPTRLYTAAALVVQHRFPPSTSGRRSWHGVWMDGSCKARDRVHRRDFHTAKRPGASGPRHLPLM